MTGMPLAADIIGEQAPNIRKAGEIPQKVAPSPGSAISFVSSAHHVTRLGCPQPASQNFILGLKYDAATTKRRVACLIRRHLRPRSTRHREDGEDPRAKVRRRNAGFHRVERMFDCLPPLPHRLGLLSRRLHLFQTSFFSFAHRILGSIEHEIAR
jgi:hypothetical protein